MAAIVCPGRPLPLRASGALYDRAEPARQSGRRCLQEGGRDTHPDLAAKGITPVTKKLWLDSSSYAELPEKVEGVAIVDGCQLILINDDDFGVEGAKTRIVRITMPKAAF